VTASICLALRFYEVGQRPPMSWIRIQTYGNPARWCYFPLGASPTASKHLLFPATSSSYSSLPKAPLGIAGAAVGVNAIKALLGVRSAKRECAISYVLGLDNERRMSCLQAFAGTDSLNYDHQTGHVTTAIPLSPPLNWNRNVSSTQTADSFTSTWNSFPGRTYSGLRTSG
jgi:hypothetical protein